jgi:hypothetical protein
VTFQVAVLMAVKPLEMAPDGSFKNHQKKALEGREARIYGLPVGVTGGIRTPDLLVRSQMLYPAELRSHLTWHF